ncbi:MAG: S-layer homology domain-containing protein [Oscillospiraceae bacterium]|nr:S-layer homology domain-containing protein [Oscillospiraceae bacterium]
MKIFKKLMALTLAAVMVFGVLTTAYAADKVKYSDAKSIKHAAAVAVLSAVDVIAGYPNGTFRPTTTVTRAEMAKILAFLLNKGEDVGEQFADACSFGDCQGHWAKGYIGYCVAQGLINGKSPTSFDPEGKVTLAEEAKMVLCALGYETSLRGYTGSDWMINVARDAATAGLFTNISELKNADPMTRDDACQLILNGLQATLVKFPNASTTLIEGDPELGEVIMNSNLKKENVTILEEGIDFDFNDRDLINDAGGSTVQLCERLFPELRLSPEGHTEIGAPAETWLLKNQTLCSENTMTATFTSDTSTTGKTLRSKLKTSLPLSCTVYLDGNWNSHYSLEQLKVAMGWENKDEKSAISAAASATNATLGVDGRGFYYQIANTGATAQFACAAAALVLCWRNDSANSMAGFSTSGGQSAIFASSGYHQEYYYDEVERHLTICSQANYPAEVRSVVPAVTDADGTVTQEPYAVLALLAGAPAGYTGGKIEIGTEKYAESTNANTALMKLSQLGEDMDIKAGERLIVTFAHDPIEEAAGKYHINSANVLEKASGVVDYVQASTGTSLSSLRVGKTTYSRAAKCPVQTAAEIKVGKNYEISYFTFGSSNLAFMIEQVTTDYAYLMSAGPTTDPLAEHKYAAKILKSDGTIETVYTVQDYWASVGYIVTYSLNKTTSEYTLTAVGGYSGSQAGAGGNVSVATGRAAVQLGGNTMTADPDTLFLVITRDTNNNQVVDVYKGSGKVPYVVAADYYAYYVENDRLKFVVLEDATIGAGSAGIYGMFVKTGKDGLKTDSLGSYYTVKAVVDGKVDTLKLTEDEYNALNPGLNIFKNLNRNSDGLVTGHVAIVGTQIVSMTQPEKGVVTFNGTTGLSYHDNVLIYVYHARTDTLEIVSSATELSAIDPNEMPFEYNTFESYYTLNPEYDYPVLAGMYLSID